MVKNEKDECIEIQVEAQVVLDCLDWDILIFNRDFKVFFANKAFLDKTGLASCDAIGQHCYKITHHRDTPCQPPHDTCPLEEMLRTGKPAIETHTHFSKDNKEFQANTVVAPLKGLGDNFFLHVSMPSKGNGSRLLEAEIALNKTLYILDVINVYQQQMEELKSKRIELENTKQELESKLRDLEKFKDLTVGREIKMIELKAELEKLKKEQSK